MRHPGVLAAACLVLAMLAPVEGSSLYERNLAVLLAAVPEGTVVEVTRFADGEARAERWTREEFAAFRAGVATAMGRAYDEGGEGVPSGTGDFQAFGDVWMDLWGDPFTVNLQAPGLPRDMEMDKIWWYGGSAAATGVFEATGGCATVGSQRLCSFVYGWFYPQSGAPVGPCWFGGPGKYYAFQPPFGAVAYHNGMALCEEG